MSLEGTDGIVVTLNGGSDYDVTYDGQDWTNLSNSPFGSDAIGNIEFGNGKFVMITNTGSTATSTDLQTWTPTGNHLPGWGSYATCRELRWVDAIGKYVAIVAGCAYPSFVSSDGVTWENGDAWQAPDGSWARGLAEGGGILVTIAADNASIGPPQPYYSLDGKSWSSGTASGGNWTMHDIAYGGGKFVAVGNSRVGITPSTPGNVMVSSDGTSWTEPAGIHGTRASDYVPGVGQIHLSGVRYNDGEFVATGGEHSATELVSPPVTYDDWEFLRTAVAYTSADAVTWAQVHSSLDWGVLARGIWNGSTWVIPSQGFTLTTPNAVPTSFSSQPSSPGATSSITTVMHGTGLPSADSEFPTRYSDSASVPTQSIVGHFEGITVSDGTLSAEIIRSGTGWRVNDIDYPETGEFSGSTEGAGGDTIPMVYTDQGGTETSFNLRLPAITRKLVTVDVTSGELSDIGSVDVEVTAAAFNASGQMYAAGFETPGVPALYTINKASGAATKIGNVVGNTIGESFSVVEGIGFNSSGSLMGVLERSDGKAVVRQIPLSATAGSVATRINLNERFVYATWDNSGTAVVGEPSDVWNNLATHNGFGTLDLVDALGNATGAAYYTEDNGTGSAAWSQSTSNPSGDLMLGSRKQASAGGTELATTVVGLGVGVYDIYWYGGDSLSRQPQLVTLTVVDSSGSVTSYGQERIDYNCGGVGGTVCTSGPLWTEGNHYAHYESVVLNNADDAVRMVTGSGSLSQFAGFQIQSDGSATVASSVLDVSVPPVDFVTDPYARDFVFADGNFFLFNSGSAIEQIDQDINGSLDPISNTFDLRTGSEKPGIANVEFSPGDGTTYPTSVTLTSATAGANIYYTTNGSDPKTSGTLYSSPVSITTARTIRAYATAGGRDSDETSASYVATVGQVSPVTFSPASGEPIPGGGLVVEMTTSTSGADVYYSTDPSDTGDPSTLYTGPIIITSNTTFKAMATKSGMTNSAKTAATYGTLGSDEVEFFYLDQDGDYAGPWGDFTDNGSPDFHFAIYLNLAASTTVNRMLITIQPDHANVTNATNASPVVITTDVDHGMSTGEYVHVYGCEGNEGANGEWAITRLSATSFSLTGSTGDGAYTGGGEFAGGGGHTSDTAADGSQTWDTEKSVWYPIVVIDEDNTQLNSAYATTFGPFTGLTRLDGYGDIVGIPGSYFTLFVELSDGRTLLKTIGF